MITFEKYAELRDAKGLKDSDVAKRANIPQSTFSDWKKGKSKPKPDKMIRIADALEMDYYEFIGPVGKFSSYKLDKMIIDPLKKETTATIELVNQRDIDKAIKLYKAYSKAIPEIQKAVENLLKPD